MVAGMPLLLVLALLAFLTYGMVRTSAPELEVRNGELVVTLPWPDAALALRRRFRLPLGAVQGVAVAPRASVPATGLRWPGTGLPGVIRAGSYGFGAQRDFWFVRRATTLLVVVLKPGQPYRRLVLEVAVPLEVALRLRPDVGAYAGAFR
jgi:hypothetical protein